MHNDVTRILEELRQDHKNMATLLNVLERESNRIYSEDHPDIDLMRDVMQYMTTYPDAVHHPKEDRIYAELRITQPELSEGFTRITVDHQNIAEQGMKLRNDLALIESGAMLRRNSVVEDALRYVNTLRNHMQWEELDLFRRVEEMIRKGHRTLEMAQFPDADDPVFGAAVEERFAKLFKSIAIDI